jgi:hypothetical protein
MNYLSEDEILNYLMTSDFNEGLSPDEFTFLLFKFRNFYRICWGKNETMKTNIDGKIRELENIRQVCENQIETYKLEKKKAEERYNKLLSRKLSWKERFKGKIILKENEID